MKAPTLILSALLLVAVSCGGETSGQEVAGTDAFVSSPAPTTEPTPTPLSVPTAISAAVPVPTPTPEPLPKLAPVSTPTATPGPAPTYLAEEIPPCMPAPGSSVDPCEPGAKGTLITEPGSLIIFDVPLLVEDLVSFPVSVHTTHIALRGTYLPGTVRCTSGHQLRGPLYVGRGQASFGLFIYCFADVRVNAYLLGTGPSTLTVIVEKSLYTRRGIYDDDDYGVEQLESRRLAYERALAEGGRFEYDGSPRGENPRSRLVVTGPPGGIGGREVVLFIGPSIRTSVEAWEVFWTWDVERREDGTVVALHPYREWFTTPFEQSFAEMELPALTQAVTAAHQARVVANGGRIGEDTDLPMLVTDANLLRQYFSDPKVGGYAPGVPTPAQPPPVPPVFESSSYTFDVAEDVEIGTVAGTVSATDPAMDTVTYSIMAGNDDGKFTIDTNTGAITVAGALDYESVTSYTLTVEASDEGGGSATATVEISVTDVSPEDLPPAPEDLAVSLADGTFTITWSAVTDAARYEAQHHLLPAAVLCHF